MVLSKTIAVDYSVHRMILQYMINLSLLPTIKHYGLVLYYAIIEFQRHEVETSPFFQMLASLIPWTDLHYFYVKMLIVE